jgi:hypothetical protein
MPQETPRTPLPDLSQEHRRLLAEFLRAGESFNAFLERTRIDFFDAIAFTAHPDILAWLDHLRSLHLQALRRSALLTLEHLLNHAQTPIEQRRTAGLILRATSPTPPRPSAAAPARPPEPAQSTTPSPTPEPVPELEPEFAPELPSGLESALHPSESGSSTPADHADPAPTPHPAPVPCSSPSIRGQSSADSAAPGDSAEHHDPAPASEEGEELEDFDDLDDDDFTPDEIAAALPRPLIEALNLDPPEPIPRTAAGHW